MKSLAERKRADAMLEALDRLYRAIGDISDEKQMRTVNAALDMFFDAEYAFLFPERKKVRA